MRVPNESMWGGGGAVEPLKTVEIPSNFPISLLLKRLVDVRKQRKLIQIHNQNIKYNILALKRTFVTT